MAARIRVRRIPNLGLVGAALLLTLSSDIATASTLPSASGTFDLADVDEIVPPYNLIRPLALLAAGGFLAAASWDEVDPASLARSLEDVGPTEPLIDVGNTYGSGWVIGGGSAAILAVGHASGKEGLRAFGADLCRSFIFTSVATKAIKYGVDRKRPSGGDLSFPSGHTSVAFATVPVIGHHLGWPAGIAAGLIAMHAGIARLEDKNHFVSDVIFGAALGLAVGDLVIQRRERLNWTAGLVVTSESLAYVFWF